MRELKPEEMREAAGGWFFCLRKSWSWKWSWHSHKKSSCRKHEVKKRGCEPPSPPAKPPVFN